MRGNDANAFVAASSSPSDAVGRATPPRNTIDHAGSCVTTKSMPRSRLPIAVASCGSGAGLSSPPNDIEIGKAA